jgi:hypothetical protein
LQLKSSMPTNVSPVLPRLSLGITLFALATSGCEGPPYRNSQRCVNDTTIEACGCLEPDGCKCRQSACESGVCVEVGPALATCAVSKEPWPACDASVAKQVLCDGDTIYTCLSGWRLLPTANRCAGVCVAREPQALCAVSQDPWPACDPQVSQEQLCDGDTPYECVDGSRLADGAGACQSPAQCKTDGVRATCKAAP